MAAVAEALLKRLQKRRKMSAVKRSHTALCMNYEAIPVNLLATIAAKLATATSSAGTIGTGV